MGDALSWAFLSFLFSKNKFVSFLDIVPFGGIETNLRGLNRNFVLLIPTCHVEFSFLVESNSETISMMKLLNHVS